MHDLNEKRSLFGTNFNLERSLSAIDGSPCLKNPEKTEDGKNTMCSPCETKCNPPRYSAMSSRKRPLRLQNELPKASASPTQKTLDSRAGFVSQGAAAPECREESSLPQTKNCSVSIQNRCGIDFKNEKIAANECSFMYLDGVLVDRI